MGALRIQERNERELGSLQRVTIATCVLSIIFVTIFTAGRLAARIKSPFIGIEDYFSVLSWALAIGLNGVVLGSLRLGFGNHASELAPENYIELSKYIWIVFIVWSFALLAAKMTFQFQLYSIFGAQRWFWWANTALLCANISWLMANVIFLLTYCRPTDKTWVLTVTSHSCYETLARGTTAVAAFNLLSDLITLALPLFVIYPLKIKFKDKLKVTALFLVGEIQPLSSIFRLWFSARLLKSYDLSYDTSQLTLWSIAVISATIISSSVLYIPLFFKYFVPSSSFYSSPSSNPFSLNLYEAPSGPVFLVPVDGRIGRHRAGNVARQLRSENDAVEMHARAQRNRSRSRVVRSTQV